MCRVPPLTGVPVLLRFSAARLLPTAVVVVGATDAPPPLDVGAPALGAAPLVVVAAPDVGAAAPPLVVAALEGLLEPLLHADSTSDAATAITAPEESRLFIRTLPEDVRTWSATDGQRRPRRD